MLVLGKKSWLQLILLVRGSTLRHTWRRLLVVMLVSVGVTIGHNQFDLFTTSITALPFSLIGLALGIFLGFRNNTSYDRFWEARKLWGRLVNTSRSLTRQILTLVGPCAGQCTDDELADIHRDLVYHLIAYVHIFRHHLRDEAELVDAHNFLPAEEIEVLAKESNRPNAIAQTLGDKFAALWRRGLIETYHLPILEASLTELLNIQGGCERIKSTPIPSSYTILIHRLVAFYVFALPFGVIDTVGIFTPAVTLMIAYAFIGLDAIGDEIEEPFGMDANDLPLSALSRMIEVNLRQRLGETELPPLLKPVDRVLS